MVKKEPFMPSPNAAPPRRWSDDQLNTLAKAAAHLSMYSAHIVFAFLGDPGDVYEVEIEIPTWLSSVRAGANGVALTTQFGDALQIDGTLDNGETYACSSQRNTIVQSNFFSVAGPTAVSSVRPMHQIAPAVLLASHRINVAWIDLLMTHEHLRQLQLKAWERTDTLADQWRHAAGQFDPRMPGHPDDLHMLALLPPFEATDRRQLQTAYHPRLRWNQTRASAKYGSVKHR